MCENIALIQEVHEHSSLFDAESLANEKLLQIGLEKLSTKRIENCSKEEIFLVMFIRATMTQNHTVMVQLPSTLLDNLFTMREIIKSMQKVAHNKEVYILDFTSNKHYYKESACSMVG